MIISMLRTPNVKFLFGSRGPDGPDLQSPFGRKFELSVEHSLPDDRRSMSRNVAEKHYDSRRDKLKNREK